MGAPGAWRLCVATSPDESIAIEPETAAVPPVSTPPPSATRAAWIASDPPGRLAPTAPRRSMAGEMAMPPVAVIESDRPLVQSLPFRPG